MFDAMELYERSERAVREIVKILQEFSYSEGTAILEAVQRILDNAAVQDYLDEKARQEGDGEKEGRK